MDALCLGVSTERRHRDAYTTPIFAQELMCVSPRKNAVHVVKTEFPSRPGSGWMALALLFTETVDSSLIKEGLFSGQTVGGAVRGQTGLSVGRSLLEKDWLTLIPIARPARSVVQAKRSQYI